jgi:short-subunit dehydrogenase
MVQQATKGRVIVITGASSGFGKGTARELARQGAHLVLAARRDQLLDDLARECQGDGGRAIAVPTDVSVPEEVEALFSRAIAEFGRVDVWINDAGVGALGRFQDVPLDIHTQLIHTNLLGTIYGSWFAYRHFLQQGSGTLINISSELGQHTVPYYSSYAASKHGVLALTRTIRQEIEQDKVQGVHVCLVMPTAHDTPFFDHVANYTGHEVNAPAPLHDPQDVVDALVALVQDPKNEKIVGLDGVVKVVMKRISETAASRIGGAQMRKTQMEQPPPGPDSRGAVEQPMNEGAEVSAGRRSKR